jgi:hypothetical protein
MNFVVCMKSIDLEINPEPTISAQVDMKGRSAHVLLQAPATSFGFNNDPSAGSPTETLLRLLLPLNDQV